MHRALDIVYEDESLAVVAKPSGMLTIPDRFDASKSNLYNALATVFPRVWTVHRLDRETSGVIVFALNEEAHRSLSMQFERRSVQKSYLALVEGVPAQAEGVIEQPLGPHPGKPGQMTIVRKGKYARTEYKVIETFKGFALVEARILTGRMHQVRVHLASIGHPLVADPLYGRREALFISDLKIKDLRQRKWEESSPALLQRTALHAWRLAFEHPVSGQRIQVEAPLPKDIKAALQQLRKWRSP